MLAQLRKTLQDRPYWWLPIEAGYATLVEVQRDWSAADWVWFQGRMAEKAADARMREALARRGSR